MIKLILKCCAAVVRWNVNVNQYVLNKLTGGHKGEHCITGYVDNISVFQNYNDELAKVQLTIINEKLDMESIMRPGKKIKVICLN